MATYKTTGIILKKRDFFETDQIITIFTNNNGKIEVVAKGVRKILTKLGGHLDLFMETRLVLAKGRNLDIVSSAEVKKTFKLVRKSLEKTACAYLFAELVDKFIQLNQKNPKLYLLLNITLEYLDRVNIRKINLDLVIIYFSLHFLKIEGLVPEINFCVHCQRRLINEKLVFSIKLGGVLDSDCLIYDRSSFPISKNFIKLMRLLLSSQITILDKINLEKNILEEYKKIILNYIIYKSEKEIKSDKFYKQIR